MDMVGSPNFMRGIYNGSEAAEEIRNGSLAIQYYLEEGLKKIDSEITYQFTEFSGRSDYQGFINNSIPAGGLFTGAEVVKTDAERKV